MLTGQKNIDFSIIMHLEDHELAKVCIANKYVKSLCDDDTFWMNRTIQKFEIDEKLGTEPEWQSSFILRQIKEYLLFKNWKEFYKWIKENDVNHRYYIVSMIYYMKEDIGEIEKEEDYYINDFIEIAKKTEMPKWIDREKYLLELKRKLFLNITDVINFDSSVFADFKHELRDYNSNILDTFLNQTLINKYLR